MKGLSMSPEIMGKLFITMFIIGVIVIMLVTFLPMFSQDICKNKQFEDINSVVNDAVATRASKTIKSFAVQSCIEHVDFSNIGCKLVNGIPTKRCYEVLAVGQASGNCDEMVIADCAALKGTIRELPGSPILWEEIGGQTKLKPGTYSVEIGPYSINFKEK